MFSVTLYFLLSGISVTAFCLLTKRAPPCQCNPDASRFRLTNAPKREQLKETFSHYKQETTHRRTFKFLHTEKKKKELCLHSRQLRKKRFYFCSPNTNACQCKYVTERASRRRSDTGKEVTKSLCCQSGYEFISGVRTGVQMS